MSIAVSTRGIKLELDANSPAEHFPNAWLTGQTVGSNYWLKEVYLASDQVSLYSLMKNNKPTGYHPPLAGQKSQAVTVYFFDEDHVLQNKTWNYAVARGAMVTVTGPDGTPETLILIDKLKVSDNPI